MRHYEEYRNNGCTMRVYAGEGWTLRVWAYDDGVGMIDISCDFNNELNNALVWAIRDLLTAILGEWGLVGVHEGRVGAKLTKQAQ